MTKITEDMIGCLCWFNNYREIVVGILKEIQTSPNGENYYLDDNGYFYPECQPVKPDEIKFYKEKEKMIGICGACGEKIEYNLEDVGIGILIPHGWCANKNCPTYGWPTDNIKLIKTDDGEEEENG